ncbi:MAG: hypothetical protein ACYCS1_09790 [Gammaproteobacteria bacterium]
MKIFLMILDFACCLSSWSVRVGVYTAILDFCFGDSGVWRRLDDGLYLDGDRRVHLATAGMAPGHENYCHALFSPSWVILKRPD